MALRFIPKSETELNRFALLPDGDYPFTVLESKEQASKSAKNAGRPMVALKLGVYADDGREVWVFDYFADWFSEWKLKHFCETTGHEKDYLAGNLDPSENGCQGWKGMVRITLGVDNNGKERNSVDDYIVEAEKTEPAVAPPPKPPVTDDDDDGLPFNKVDATPPKKHHTKKEFISELPS